MRLVTIPPSLRFLDTLAVHWLGATDPADLARGLILLPTRRAARALVEAFLRACDGRPLLLPRITAIGALDETPLALRGALDLPPAVAPEQRLATLARMVMALPSADGGAATADRAWLLAGELAALMDEAERAEVDLRDALPRAADAAFAEHWRKTLRFLEIVTHAWPDWLAAQGLMNPAERQRRLLDAQAEAWRMDPPREPIWVAGVSGGIPSVARLLRVVAGLPSGLVVLPGLDVDLPDSVWAVLDEAHPLAGLKRLLNGMGATRGDVAVWAPPPERPSTERPSTERPVLAGRARLLSQALLPAPALRAWRDDAARTDEPAGLFRLSCADPQEEAVAIAMILRDALETQGAHAALVTPDRALAGRVSAELLRWGVVADDSAGEQLAATPPAVFLRLIAGAVADRLGPVALLAALKHPLAAAGLAPAACRALVRQLEIAVLRGPRPQPGLAGLRKHASDAPASVQHLLDAVQTCLAPLLRVFEAPRPRTPARGTPADMLAALIATGEALAATDQIEGPERLWAHEEGEALATALAAAMPALAVLPDQPASVLPGLLDALLRDQVVRSRRALRGRAQISEHPRVFIWGLLEARLQAVDVVVLGGLVEGVWPAATDPGPWLSRPMREAIGLPSPEERIGQAAHDFVMAACCAPVTVLSCPGRRDGAPVVPARWLTRLDACLTGRGAVIPAHPASAWARRLDQPDGAPQPVMPPEPRPPLALRPRRLSVTEIATWVADPYAIHARHILRLRPLDPLEQETDAADYGSLVHDALHRFLSEAGASWPADATARLRVAMDHALREKGLRQALFEWWAPRLARIADWICAHEIERRAQAAPAAILAEAKGKWAIDVPGGFTLTGRADRIERYPDGTLAILDYKTGQPPSQRDVVDGLASQLPLEAAMAEAGAFGAEAHGTARKLIYWHLSGGFEAGSETAIGRGDAAAIAEVVRSSVDGLVKLIRQFDDKATAYLAQPHPGRRPRFSDYAQLARLAEWDRAGDDA